MTPMTLSLCRAVELQDVQHAARAIQISAGVAASANPEMPIPIGRNLLGFNRMSLYFKGILKDLIGINSFLLGFNGSSWYFKGFKRI